VRHHLDLVLEALGEHRPDRAVDQAHGQDLLGRRASLALEEPARDLARGLGLLAVVDGQREEILLLARGAGGDGGEGHRFAQGRDHGAVRLAGDDARFEDDPLAADRALDSYVVELHRVKDLTCCCLRFSFAVDILPAAPPR
jgi:hypothetical protein